MKDRLEAFRQRHRVAAIGAATLDISRDVADDVDVYVVGVTRRAGTEAVVVSDAWHIGSCAKALTAALYARLVEQGRAEWGTRISDLFPDLADAVHDGWALATIDDLFTCRSGLPANPTRQAMSGAYRDHRPAVDQRTAAARSALIDPPRNQFRFLYSNLGYVVAGAAIDRLAGQSFEALLRSEILDPLGVTSAGFGPPPRILGHRPRVQIGNFCLGRGDPADATDIHSDNPPLLTPAGRLHLSLSDWARVQRLFLDGAGLLAPASLEHLLRRPSDGRGMAMGWASSRGLPGIELGMQGSNTMWAATALMSDDRRRMAMVITNDGRTSLLGSTALLAADLLAGHGP
ncbi:MAG TPA: serine hydrolase [Patescibacteria group bacterium]|nr:serine hydrolase [Patescibacteria group bacterium]